MQISSKLHQLISSNATPADFKNILIVSGIEFAVSLLKAFVATKGLDTKLQADLQTAIDANNVVVLDLTLKP